LEKYATRILVLVEDPCGLHTGPSPVQSDGTSSVKILPDALSVYVREAPFPAFTSL
jgi:hypothetical protein